MTMCENKLLCIYTNSFDADFYMKHQLGNQLATTDTYQNNNYLLAKWDRLGVVMGLGNGLSKKTEEYGLKE